MILRRKSLSNIPNVIWFMHTHSTNHVIFVSMGNDPFRQFGHGASYYRQKFVYTMYFGHHINLIQEMETYGLTTSSVFNLKWDSFFLLSLLTSSIVLAFDDTHVFFHIIIIFERGTVKMSYRHLTHFNK